MSEPCLCGAKDCEKCYPFCNTPIKVKCEHAEVPQRMIKECDLCGADICEKCDICEDCKDGNEQMNTIVTEILKSNNGSTDYDYIAFKIFEAYTKEGFTL